MPGDDVESAGSYEVASFTTLNPLLWRPISAGVWKHHELVDGTYDVGDLLDILEYLDIHEENKRRQRLAAQQTER